MVIHAKLNLKKLFHDRSQSLGGSPFGIHATASRCQIYNMTKSKQQMNPLKINFETSVSHEKLLTKIFRKHVVNININMLAACISSIHSVSFTVGVS